MCYKTQQRPRRRFGADDEAWPLGVVEDTHAEAIGRAPGRLQRERR